MPMNSIVSDVHRHNHTHNINDKDGSSNDDISNDDLSDDVGDDSSDNYDEDDAKDDDGKCIPDCHPSIYKMNSIVSDAYYHKKHGQNHAGANVGVTSDVNINPSLFNMPSI
jgi:hypothetical protein